MSKSKARSGLKTARCSFLTFLFMTTLALTFSSVALAQEHGAGVSKGCNGPIRTCETDADCSDTRFGACSIDGEGCRSDDDCSQFPDEQTCGTPDACVPGVCDTGITAPNEYECTFTATYLDQLSDVLILTEAF